MSYLMTWASCIQSSSIIAIIYSIGPSIHMPGECMAREQSRTGIITTHIKESCISFTRYFSTCGINHFVAKIAERGPPFL